MIRLPTTADLARFVADLEATEGRKVSVSKFLRLLDAPHEYIRVMDDPLRLTRMYVSHERREFIIVELWPYTGVPLRSFVSLLLDTGSEAAATEPEAQAYPVVACFDNGPAARAWRSAVFSNGSIVRVTKPGGAVYWRLALPSLADGLDKLRAVLG